MKNTNLWATSLVVFILFCQWSCSKTDFTNKLISEKIEKRFFDSRQVKDPTRIAIIDFLKRKNSNEAFVQNTVSRICYPIWDKALSPRTKKRLGRNSSAGEITYYIPFVRDSQNYVNAAMVVYITHSDTTFSYLCDWQYSHKQNSISEFNDEAEQFAVFFMVMNKEVFGNKKFEITDPNLFRQGNQHASYIALSDSNHLPGLTNLLAVEYCQDVIITYVDCPFTNIHPYCTPTRDRCPLCMSSITYNYCWTEYRDDGGGGTAGNGC